MSNDWQSVDIGGGGFVTGMDIAPDNTMVVRTDTYGAYIWNGAQWQQLLTSTSMPTAFVIPSSGRGVYEIRIAPSNTNILYMEYSGYVFRSNDRANWTQTNFAPVNVDATDPYRMNGQKMAVDPHNPNVVYVGTSRDGLFVTTDAGVSWQRVGALPVSAQDSNGVYPGITGITFDPTSGISGGRTNVIYASSNGHGVYQSTNGGTTWTLIGGPSDVESATLSTTGTYYAVGNNSVWQFANGVWTEFDPRIFQDPHTVSVNPFNPLHIVVAAGGGSLNQSLDGGVTWSGQNRGTELSATDIPWLATSGEYMTMGNVLFDRLAPNTLWASAGVGVWTTAVPQNMSWSTPIVWKSQTIGIEQLVANEIMVPPDGQPIFASWDRPFFYVDDPDIYPSSYGVGNSYYFSMGWSIDYASTTPSFLVAINDWWGVEQSGYSSDGGQTWHVFPTMPSFAHTTIGGSIAASSPTEIIWAPANRAAPQYTQDGGLTWHPIVLPGVTDWSDFHFAYYLNRQTVTADRVLEDTFYLYYVSMRDAASNGVYRSTDSGATWTKVFNGEISNWSYYNARIEAVPGEAGHLFFTGGPQSNADASQPARQGFYQSTDGGATWTAVPNVLEVMAFGFGAPAPGGDYLSIYIVGWVNGVYGIWQSNDDAESWTLLGDYPVGILDGISTISGDPNIYGQVYVGFAGAGYAYLPADGASTPNASPTITSNGGGTTASILIAENSTAVTRVTATDVDGPAVTYAIAGGADAARFTINGSTGALSFATAPNFEAPADAGANNIYDVIVQASDGHGGIDPQAIAVGVQNVVGASIHGTAGNDVIDMTHTVAGQPFPTTEEDTLEGGLAADLMAGGLGNDIYVVDNAGDVVSEAGSAGTDTVRSSVTHTLGVNVENLVLTGVAAINGTGNALNNSLTGNAGINTLDGGLAADLMAGGLGNDIYVVDNAGDVVSEAGSAGTDTVRSSVTHTLGVNVENLVLTGVAAINGTGNALNNSLTGNAGINTLDGGLAADLMAGGLGNDIYVVDNAGDVVSEAGSAGTDTVRSSVTYTLGGNVENLVLTGVVAINGTGNALNNSLTGNAGINTLDGGLAADLMAGGLGNDIYVVDNAGDVVSEAGSAGTDTVRSSVTHTLGVNVENLVLTGVAAINGTGNALNNSLTGNAGINTLDGGLAADLMAGGLGNDIYVVDNAGDVVSEAGSAGTDTVRSSVTYTLGGNVENLVLTGVVAINGTGNALNNSLTGNAGINTLDGGLAADLMAGGLGNDIYVVDNAGDVVSEAGSAGTDTVRSSVTHTLGVNVENLVLTGVAAINGTGNALNNSLTGNAGINTLDGGLAADLMAGGLGNDIYVVDNAGDVVSEAGSAGTDTVRSSVTHTLGVNVENLVLTGVAAINGTGNALNNSLTGNAGINTLDGGLAADLMAGGLGNDIYVVDNAGDVVSEAGSAGTDTVRSSVTYTLGGNVENLVLTGVAAINGTGNALNNSLTGNAGINTLDGGLAADLMAGGLGNDIYVVDNAGDVVSEAGSAGTDTVRSSVTHTLGVNVENLVLTGVAAINGTGNALNNSLTGNAGINTLDGGLAADLMAGGLGNDIYVVDNAGDVVSEAGSAGTDTVRSSVTYTLGGNVENLVLTGVVAINGTGNALNNSLTGNGANNVINGGGGTDMLSGNGGNDTFVFNFGQANLDTIIDFDGLGPAAGDSLRFVGYGAGATFTEIDATHWQINAGASHEVITFSNAAPLHASDYFFA